MYKFNMEQGLVYKILVNKHTCRTPLLPWKTNKQKNSIHCSRNVGLSFPYNQKHASLETFFLRKARAALLNEVFWLARSRSLSGRYVCGCTLPGEVPVQGVLTFMMSWRAIIEEEEKNRKEGEPTTTTTKIFILMQNSWNEVSLSNSAAYCMYSTPN